jgi:hypothetical protein
MHPDKRHTMILLIAVAIIAGGLLAWRYGILDKLLGAN